MSCVTCFTHRCQAWQPESFIEPDSSSPYHEFFIEVFARFEPAGEDGRSFTSFTKYEKIIMRRDLLIMDGTSWSLISKMLSRMDVPYSLQPFVIQKISTFARELATESYNMNRKTIPMVVTIYVVLGTQEHELSEAFSLCMITKLLRASKSSVKALEKTEMEGFPTRCVVCLEDILMGSKATRMPCSHVYHRDCIVNWLKKSNLCPLCRFQMPAE